MHIWLQDVRYPTGMQRKTAALAVVSLVSLASVHFDLHD